MYFGRCELRASKRELVVDGVVQHVQPRVFALLLYLVEHRDRVVTRGELLQHIWKTSYVSDSVIGRCIMKARRVIQDDDPNSPIIKTLPRTGYRFVGMVRQSDPSQDRETVEFRQSPRTPVVVATLPFVNLTGQPELNWVEFGLASLLNGALKEGSIFNVAPLLDVVAVVQGVSDRESLAHERCAIALNAQAVIAAEVRCFDDRFELKCRMQQYDRDIADIFIHGADLAKMTLDLGHQVRRALAPRPELRSTQFQVEDSFAGEAFIRAMNAAKEQRYQLALHYLEICMIPDIHPAYVELEYFSNLAAVEHPDTLARGARLLASAEARGDVLEQARVLHALSSYHNARGNHATARALIENALSLVERAHHGGHGLAPDVLLHLGEMAIVDREFDLARHLKERAVALSDSSNDHRVLSRSLCQEGVIAHLHGDSARALELLGRSAELIRQPHPQCSDLARVMHRVAIVYRDAGRLREAIFAIDEAVECARIAGIPARHALSLAFQVTLNNLAGDRTAAEEARVRLASANIQRSRIGRFLNEFTAAWLHWRAGRTDEALSLMDCLRPRARELRNFWLSFVIGTHAGLAIAAGKIELATELIDEIELNQTFYRGTHLQQLAQYFYAALAHRQGDRELAWDTLRGVISNSCCGILKSNACLSAAWLACEERSLHEAQSWLDQVPGWTREHPAGLMLLARYRFELGDAASAASIQEQHLARWPAGEAPPFQRGLLCAYREASDSGAVTAIPRLPHFVGLYF